MKTFEELVATETYWLTIIQNTLFNEVEEYLQNNQLTRTKFAEQLGVSKGYISQILNGDFNHRLSKLVQLSIAIGKVPILEFKNLEDFIEEEKQADKINIQNSTPKLKLISSLNGQ